MNKLEIFHADAYEKVSGLIAAGVKVDHIITDPPYNISKENNFNTMKNNIIMSDKTETLTGRGFYYEEVNDKKFRISANSFFQVNPETAGKIFESI